MLLLLLCFCTSQVGREDEFSINRQQMLALLCNPSADMLACRCCYCCCCCCCRRCTTSQVDREDGFSIDRQQFGHCCSRTADMPLPLLLLLLSVSAAVSLHHITGWS
jgi:hypothetical protein